MRRLFTTFGLSLCFVVTLLLPLCTTPAQAADRPPTYASSTATVLGVEQNGVTDDAVQPDLSSVVVTLDDLPAGFAPISSVESVWGTSDIGLQDIGIEHHFAFEHVQPPMLILGFTGLAPTNLQRAFFDSMVTNPQEVLMLAMSSLPEGIKAQPATRLDVTGLGDSAAGISTTAQDDYGVGFRLDMILLRREMVGAIVMVAYLDGQTPLISAYQVAQLLDERVMAAVAAASGVAPAKQPTPAANLTTKPEESAKVAEMLPEAAVQVKRLNVRTGPGITYAVVDGVQLGERLSIVGQVDNCAWLQIVTPDGKIGWVSAAKQYVTYTVSCEQITADGFRPHSGTLLGGAVQLAGAGQLMVQSEYRNDAVVVLTRLDGTLVTAFYLRGYETFTLMGIPEGRYQVVYTTGERWDQQTGRFAKNVRYRQFDGDYAIDTTLFASTVHTLRIRPTTGGTTAIAADEFPDLGQGN